jgi:hypothetical protein
LERVLPFTAPSVQVREKKKFSRAVSLSSTGFFGLSAVFFLASQAAVLRAASSRGG